MHCITIYFKSAVCLGPRACIVYAKQKILNKVPIISESTSVFFCELYIFFVSVCRSSVSHKKKNGGKIESRYKKQFNIILDVYL